MTTYNVRELIVDHWASDNLWPVTEDTDFSKVSKWRSRQTYTRGNDTLYVESHRYDPYSAVARTGHLDLPVPYKNRDATKEPHQDVMDAMVEDLKGYAKAGCTVIRWRHAWFCFEPVTRHLGRMFNLVALDFGDDVPGSTEVKVEPVIYNFDAVIHQMFTFDYATGKKVGDLYSKDYGVDWVRHALLGPSTPVARAKPAPEVERDVLLTFVGAMGMQNPGRVAFLKDLNYRAHELEGVTKLHGSCHRDGYLPNEELAPLYRRSRFGVNYPASSLWNGRCFDLFLTGCVQICPDKWDELPVYGFKPWEHFIPFNGTVDGLLYELEALEGTPPPGMAQKAREQAVRMLAEHSTAKVTEDMLWEHLEHIA